MPNDTVSAAATGLPDRRLFLAAGPAVAVLASLRKAAADEPPVLTLIERHRATGNALSGCCDFASLMNADHPQHEAAAAEFRRMDAIDDNALTAICAHKPVSAADARAKGEYLAAYHRGTLLEEHHISALLESFITKEV